MKIGSGIIRRLDQLGRIVIPREIRKVLELNEHDYIEISMQDSNIVLSKYENKCVFCGAMNPRNNFKGKKICKKCLEELKSE